MFNGSNSYRVVSTRKNRVVSCLDFGFTYRIRVRVKPPLNGSNMDLSLSDPHELPPLHQTHTKKNYFFSSEIAANQFTIDTLTIMFVRKEIQFLVQ